MESRLVYILIILLSVTGVCYCDTLSEVIKTDTHSTTWHALSSDKFSALDRKYQIAHWMTAGGIGCMIVPAFFEESDFGDFLIVSGFISFMVGMPLMGHTAGKMCRIAEQVDNDYRRPMGGFRFYLIGKGVQFLGMTVLTFEVLRFIPTMFLGGEMNEDVIDVGDMLIVAGVFFDFFAWYRFSRMRKSAKGVVGKSSLGLSLFRDGQSRLIPGAVATFDF